MLKANLIISLRSLKKHLVYTWVNVLGLSVALCSVFLTYLYTQHEWTFDQSYPDSDQIYRLVLEGHRGANSRTNAISFLHSKGFDENFPAVEALSRKIFNYTPELVRTEERYELAFEEDQMIYAEPSFLSIFQPKLISGDEVLFDQAWKVLISQKAAQKYFGADKAVGKAMIIGNAKYEVIGVYENFATNSSLRPDFLISIKTMQTDPEEADTFLKDGYYVFHTYLKVAAGTDLTELEAALTADTKSRGIFRDDVQRWVLDPLEGYHFQTTDYISTLAPKADEKLIVWLMAIASGLMLVAIANFGNISLAIALNKTKEIAVRKIVGARKHQLVKRSLFESMLLCIIAFLLGLILLELTLPIFSNFVDRELTQDSHGLTTYLILFAMTMGVGFVAGLYPALLLSNIKIMHLFKAASREKRSRFSFRNLLLSFQFIITFVLLALTFVMNRQVNYLLAKDPGFDFEDVVVFTPSWGTQGQMSTIYAFKDRLLAMPEIADISLSDIHPLMILRDFDMRHQLLKERKRTEKLLTASVDCHFFDFYNMDTELTSDVTQQFCEDAFIVALNQRARDGFETDATGKSFVHYYKGEFVYPVVQEGKVNDMDFISTKDPYIPMAFMPIDISNSRVKYNIKLKEGTDQRAFIDQLNEMWWDLKPYEPFDLRVLEEEHLRVYSSELKLQTMAGALAMAVCVIAFAGVFALSIFYGRQRLKEVGIRKVLGASFKHLFLLQSKSFLIILTVSCMAAIPIVRLVADSWLNQFVSRVAPSSNVYLFAAATMVVCTILSVGWYSSKVARVNPADIIRDK